MGFILKVKPRYRLQIGIIALILAAIAFYITWNNDTGFFVGFVAGILLGAGIGLVATYKKQE